MSPLSPNDIRIIREGLGLTQREAGELLGGGPNAFAKYESGQTTPSTAFAHLLILLKADPGALNTLHPERAIHTPTARPLPFEVTFQHLAVVSKQTFPEFIRLLLGAEASSHGVPADGIHVADNVDARDGGEDGRIHWDGGPERTPFLPCRLCQFQLKTGKVEPAVVGREVLTKGKVKPMIRSVLKQGGHYTVLSTNAHTRQQIEAREFRIREALRSAGQEIDDVQVHFLDAGQLAAWVNTHPAVAHWLLERAEPGLLGPFRTWSHWANRAEHFGSPWVDDERLGNLRRFLREQIAIGQPRRAARVVGLAGVGKSRLALEAFRSLDSSDREPTVLSSLVLYAVEGEVSPEPLKSAVQKLADSGKRAIVVVDQCAPETHRTLALMAYRDTSQLSLLTLDDEMPSGTLAPSTHKVGEAPSAVAEAIVGRVAPGLQSSDQQRLVRFSGGFPGVANSIARAWIDATPLAHVTDDDLVNAYVLGRGLREPELSLRSAQLLATFGLIGIETEADDQLAKIAHLGRGLSPDDLYTGLIRLVERGIARRRGRYVSIQPGPITMKLAERQWKEWHRNTWDKVLADKSTSPSFTGNLRLNVLVAKQLRFLDGLDVSKAVVNHVCRYGGPFHGLDGILAEGHAEILSHLAEIDTIITVELLKNLLAEVEDLSSIVGETRSHLVWALRKIAFKADTFEDGACLLLCLAAAAKEDRDNHATGQFVALFPCILGSTEADGTQRLNLLDRLSKTDDTIRKEIVIRALAAGLELEHFSRDVGPEVHGTRPALNSWHPGTGEEARAYVRGCATQLIEFAAQSDDTGALARHSLDPALGALIEYGFVEVVELAVERVEAVTGHWTEARNTLGLYLSRHCTHEPGELVDRVQAMIDRLTPKSLEARVRFLVTETPWEYLYTGNDSYEEQHRCHGEAVRELAAEAVRQPESLQALLPQLSCGRQQMAREFGQAVAETADSKDFWLTSFILAAEEAPEAERNYELLVGYVRGFADSRPDAAAGLKQRAAKSPVLAPALPLMCSTLGLTPLDIALMIAALQEGLLSPGRLTWETIGISLRNISPEEVLPLLDAMLDHSREGFAGALELLGLYVYGNHNGLDAFRPQIRKIAENALRWPWHGLPNSDTARHHLTDILGWMLDRGPDDPDASATALALSKVLANMADINLMHRLDPVLPILLSEFPGVAWPLIGTAIIADEPRRDFLFETLLREQSLSDPGKRLDHGETCAPILKLPEGTLFAWCHAHPERAPAFVAKTVPFFDSDGNADKDLCVHPVMVRLIKEFGSRDDITDAILSAMWTKGYLGPEEHLWTTCLKSVTKLLSYEHPNVQRWAKATLRRLRQLIDHAHVRDAEMKTHMEY